MSLLKKLNWRYATKRMNGKRVPKEPLNRILEAIRLAASSNGLQPYHILVIGNAVLKEKIHQAACTQPQIMECSHLLVFASWTEITEKDVDAFIQNTATTRDMSLEKLSTLRTNLLNIPIKRTPEQVQAWTAKQVYIALGFGLVAAAIEGVDATPMEGFDGDKMDELLGLKAKNLHTAVIMTLGYRDVENDWLMKLKKVRRSKEEHFTTID